MPGQGSIPQRAVRVDDETWQAALAAARAEGETLSDVVRRALVRYARRVEKKAARAAEEAAE